MSSAIKTIYRSSKLPHRRGINRILTSARIFYIDKVTAFNRSQACMIQLIDLDNEGRRIRCHSDATIVARSGWLGPSNRSYFTATRWAPGGKGI